MGKVLEKIGLGWILLICIIVATVAIVLAKGFKVGLKYGENTQIDINIGFEFNVEDVKSIVKEVFPKQSVMVRQVEIYKDMVEITVKEASDEQIEDLNNKINDKYGTTNQISDISVINNTNTKLRDIAKPYIIPILISSVVILIYEMVRFRKLGVGKVTYKLIMKIIVPQILLFGAYAIFRIPINRVTVIISLVLYILSCYSTIPSFLAEFENN